MHYVWVVRSASGWWFVGVTDMREGEGVGGLRLVGCEQSFRDLVGGLVCSSFR